MSLNTSASRTRVCRLVAVLCLFCVSVVSAQTLQQPPYAPAIHIDGYGIDATLDPARHTLTAQTTVSFTAQRNTTSVSFELNPALRVAKITDAKGLLLDAERVSSTSSGIDALGALEDASSLRVTPPAPLHKGESASWTFTYSGVLANEQTATTANSPQLAAIGDPVSYLLYGAQWFPMVGYMTDRFTASMRVHIPVGERVLGSGPTGTPHQDENGQMVFDFQWSRPGFPGTLLAGKFIGPYTTDTGSNVRVYRIDTSGPSKAKGLPFDEKNYATIADQEYSYFASQYGPADSNQINVVELPDDTVPAYWAPEIAAIAGAQMRGENAFRLLSNTLAHQWWGNDDSPATLDDAWITNGMCRYAELMYLKNISSPAAFTDAVLDVSAGALAYDTIPLADASRYSVSSPEFQSMTYDKGAMIFRMLQWQLGDAAFQTTLHTILSQFADTSISSAQVEAIAEAASHQDLQPFFTQWLHSTGAPDMQAKWTLYRLGNNKGFRTVGEIDQDLDLFRMPVDLRIETEGKTVNQRIEVVGAHSQFVVDTFGMPRKVTLDPEHWLLRNDTAMQVRVHILRGQQKAARDDYAGAIQEYRQALALDNISSLASYRLGEVYFQQRNYQAAEGAYRDALHGDDVPKWTEVWSDLELGKIFDASGQRDRAVNRYREALQTGDNTGGALDLARAYLQQAYKPSTEHTGLPVQ